MDVKDEIVMELALFETRMKSLAGNDVAHTVRSKTPTLATRCAGSLNRARYIIPLTITNDLCDRYNKGPSRRTDDDRPVAKLSEAQNCHKDHSQQLAGQQAATYK